MESDGAAPTKSERSTRTALLSSFTDRLDPELREVLEAFHDPAQGGGHVTLEEVRAAAEKWKHSRGERAGYPITAFPEALAEQLSVFDLNQDGTVDKSELVAAAKLYAEKKKEARRLRKAVVFLSALCLALLGGFFAVSYLASELSKEMRASESGMMRISGGVVAGTASAAEPVELADFPDLDVETLKMASVITFTADGFEHVFHISSISKGQLASDGESDEESVVVHVRGGSGQVLAIYSNGSMSYEASLADPLSSGRRLTEAAGTGDLELTTSDSGGKCTTYCPKVKQDKFSWEEMCSTGPSHVVKKCSGCRQCEDVSYSGACALDCVDFDDKSWKTRCKWAQCAACSECAAEATTTTTKTTATFTTTSTSTVTFGPSVGSFTAVTGEPFSVTLPLVPPFEGSVIVDLEAAPAGLSVNERSRVVTWQPDLSQTGDFLFGVVYLSAEGGEVERRSMGISVAEGSANPAGLYVWPTGGSDSNPGTPGSPFASVEHAAQQAQPGDTIYVRGGRYLVKDEVRVQASPGQPVVITRLPGERVRFHPEANRNAFYVPRDSVGIVFRGLEIYGGAEKDDHWEILRHTWWQVQDQRVGGKMGFDIDGQHVVVEDCVIHDVSQKAVNVKEGRYVTVRHNVIYNVGHSSISGGHGIMRQWKMNFGDADEPDLFRWDFYGNLLFAVEQRIYSFIPSKGYCHMTIDEGKSILIDETADDEMKARIAHNVLLFGGVDHIRLKKNPNMQVVNNAVLAEQGRTSPTPDGITAVKRPSIPGLNMSGNLVQTFEGSFAFDVADHFSDEESLSRLSNNYYCGGSRTRTDLPGISDLGANATVFRDAAALDFRASEALPQGVGVSEEVLERLNGLVEDFAVNVSPSGWRHDHVRMVQTIVESAPQEHVSFAGEGDSEKESGEKALWFDVISAEYADFCKCQQIELIPPHEYWDAVA